MFKVLTKVMGMHEEMNEKFEIVSKTLHDFKEKYESDMRSMIDAFEEKKSWN